MHKITAVVGGAVGSFNDLGILTLLQVIESLLPVVEDLRHGVVQVEFVAETGHVLLGLVAELAFQRRDEAHLGQCLFDLLEGLISGRRNVADQHIDIFLPDLGLYAPRLPHRNHIHLDCLGRPLHFSQTPAMRLRFYSALIT